MRTGHLTTISSPTLQSVEEQPISQIWKLLDILYPAAFGISEAHPQGPMLQALLLVLSGFPGLYGKR